MKQLTADLKELSSLLTIPLCLALGHILVYYSTLYSDSFFLNHKMLSQWNLWMSRFQVCSDGRLGSVDRENSVGGSSLV